MNVAIGADHAGFEMKERVKQYLESHGHSVQDVGTHSTESTDYPPFAFRVAEAVRDGKAERGILLVKGAVPGPNGSLVFVKNAATGDLGTSWANAGMYGSNAASMSP